MKKITLLFLVLITSYSFSQDVWTTGQVPLTSGYTVQFDVTNSTVTMTMIGPSNRWLGVGVTNTTYSPGNGMAQFQGEDVFTYQNSAITDRSFPGFNGMPPVDSVQNWSVSSNNVSSGTRTVIATRDRNTGDSNDFVFPISPGTLTIVWALGATGTDTGSLAFHSGGRNATLANITLSNDEFLLANAEFIISPNPSSTRLNIDMQSLISADDTRVEVYDVLGKQVHRSIITQSEISIDTSNWRSGIYLVKVSNSNGSQTKRFIRQ